MDEFQISDIEFEEIENDQSSDTSNSDLTSNDISDIEFEHNDVPMEEFDDFEEEDVIEKFAFEETEIFENTAIDLFQQLMLSGLSRELTDKMNKKVRNLLDLACCLIGKVLGSEDSKINDCFRLLTDILKSQSSNHKRECTAKKSQFFVNPIPVVYGHKFVQVRRNNRPVHINKPLVMYTIPIKETITALFKSPVFRESYENRSHQCQEGVYENFCCSSSCQNGSFSLINQSNAIRVQLYCDTVNLGDALKQNANDHKIGAVYFRILNQEPNVLSQIHNIHLVGESQNEF